MTLDYTLFYKALSPLIKPTSNFLGKKIVGSEILDRREYLKTALEPRLKTAINEVAEIIEQVGVADIDQIHLFLCSDAAEVIVRQIYAGLVQDKTSFLELQTAFLHEFSLYTNISPDELADTSSQIFNSLIKGCEQVLKSAIDQGVLSAHEANSTYRHQVVMDELTAIEKKLSFLQSHQNLNPQAIEEYAFKYRQQIIHCYSKITPHHINVVKKLPIEESYVSPTFVTEIKHRVLSRTTKRRYCQPAFYQEIHRTILLGDPGGGKSTCSQHLMFELASSFNSGLVDSRKITPVLVVVRDYAIEKSKTGCSIIEFIKKQAKSKYQLPAPPSGTFEYLANQGRLLIDFDGLDELSKSNSRREMVQDVEAFCNLYPAVPVLVTSREVGYQEAPLDPSKFIVYRLTPFDNKQVREYVVKWYSFDDCLLESEQLNVVNRFLKESKTLEDLRSNPLMLSLMCNLYKREGYIPKNRPKVLEMCATLLFETWDKGRGIGLPESIINIESKISPLMKYIAHWIYQDEDLQSGVSESKLVYTAADYLENHLGDRDEAEMAAKELIRFFRGRAWVFTNVGTNRDDEELYQFTHRTFLEYFTAEHICRNYRDLTELLDLLLPRILNQEWHLVCQLVFHIQHDRYDHVGDELLNYLLDVIKQQNLVGKAHLLLFISECLKFISPSYFTVERFLSEYLKLIEILIDEPENHLILATTRIFNCLIQASSENYGAITQFVRTYYDSKKQSFSESERISFLEFIHELSDYILDANSKRNIFFSNSNFILAIARQDLTMAYLCLDEALLSTEEFCSWYGLSGLFYSHFARFRSNLCYTSISTDLLEQLLYRVPGNESLEVIKILDYIGKAFLTSSIPIINQENYQSAYNLSLDTDNIDILFSSSTFYQEGDKIFTRVMGNNRDALFGAFCLFAINLELSQELPQKGDYLYVNEDDYTYREISEAKIPFLKYTKNIFLARYNLLGCFQLQVEADLDQCDFNHQQRNFILNWIKGNLLLIDPVIIED